MNEEAAPPDVDLLAAALRADSADLDEYGEQLARKLEQALPHNTKVERRRQGLLGPRRVTRITVTLPQERLELTTLPGGFEARYARVSGGIAVKHEALELDGWVRRLSEALLAESQRTDTARQALRDLLI